MRELKRDLPKTLIHIYSFNSLADIKSLQYERLKDRHEKFCPEHTNTQPNISLPAKKGISNRNWKSPVPCPR